MFLTCTLIWVGVTLLPDLYLVSTTHIGIWAALLTFLLFEGYGPVCGASMSPARTLAYFLAGGFSAARGWLYFLICQEDYVSAFVYQLFGCYNYDSTSIRWPSGPPFLYFQHKRLLDAPWDGSQISNQLYDASTQSELRNFGENAKVLFS